MSLLAQYSALFRNTVITVLTCCVAALAALILHRIVFAIAGRFTGRTPNHFDDSLVRRSRGPARLILPLVALMAVSPALRLSEHDASVFRHAIGLGLIAAVGWLAISLLGVFEDVLVRRYRIDVADNLVARRIQTQVSVIQRIVNAAIVVVTVAVMLMTFP